MIKNTICTEKNKTDLGTVVYSNESILMESDDVVEVLKMIILKQLNMDRGNGLDEKTIEQHIKNLLVFLLKDYFNLIYNFVARKDFIESSLGEKGLAEAFDQSEDPTLFMNKLYLYTLYLMDKKTEIQNNLEIKNLREIIFSIFLNVIKCLSEEEKKRPIFIIVKKENREKIPIILTINPKNKYFNDFAKLNEKDQFQKKPEGSTYTVLGFITMEKIEECSNYENYHKLLQKKLENSVQPELIGLIFAIEEKILSVLITQSENFENLHLKGQRDLSTKINKEFLYEFMQNIIFFDTTIFIKDNLDVFFKKK